MVGKLGQGPAAAECQAWSDRDTLALTQLTLLALNRWDWGQGNRCGLKQAPGDQPSRNEDKACHVRAESRRMEAHGTLRLCGCMLFLAPLRTDRQKGKISTENLAGAEECLGCTMRLSFHISQVLCQYCKLL